MGIEPNKEDIFAFLQDPGHPHGVLGYHDARGCPDSAFVAFSATPGLEIIFGTSDQRRKYGCLRDSSPSYVSFNVTDVAKRHTVQYQGLAVEIPPDELERYEAAHYAKLGGDSQQFQDRPDEHFFRINPRPVRFSDCMEEPWTITILRPPLFA